MMVRRKTKLAYYSGKLEEIQLLRLSNVSFSTSTVSACWLPVFASESRRATTLVDEVPMLPKSIATVLFAQHFLHD